MPDINQIHGSGSSSSPRYIIPSQGTNITAFRRRSLVNAHRELLANVTPEYSTATPMMFVTVLPFYEPSASGSELNQLALEQYRKIETELDSLQKSEDDIAIDKGAIDTARALVSEIKNRQLAPPEISWMGNEAIILLWALSNRKLALTITDGEFGYIVRDGGKTIRRQSNIAPNNFDLVKLG